MVKAVPDGFHTLTPSLVVSNGTQAIEFYKRAFGAEELFRNYAPDGKTIFHAEIKIGNSILMLSDEIPSMQCLSPQSLGGSPVSMYVYVEDVDTMFNQAVSAGATIVMQLTDAFWGDRFCQLKDPFGHTWSLATRKQNLSPEELEKAAKAAFSEMAKQ